MGIKQDRPTACVLASGNPSSFSSTSSAASATSAATSRSGGSKLLFGEIDTNSDRSSEIYASVCSFVLCDSGIFLTFWLNDQCRDTFLQYLPKKDLANLRLACHDFSVRAAPSLFSDLSIIFRTNIFTKPSRLAALDRLGFYVKNLTFSVPHTADTFLPPLVEPETGAELSFTYTPQLQAPSPSQPKYGDAGTTEILTRQYPPIFHAATNVPAFIRAFSAFINLSHLEVQCPGYDINLRYRRSVVDFTLISLRIALEQNRLNALNSLSLSPIHPGGLLSLSPVLGQAATPRSMKVWSQIRTLNINAYSLPQVGSSGDPDCFKLVQAYLRLFQNTIRTLHFAWKGKKGPLPVQTQLRTANTHPTGVHPAQRHPATGHTIQRKPLPPPKSGDAERRAKRSLYFPKLRYLTLQNMATPAEPITTFAEVHKQSIHEVNFDNVRLTSGTWDEALAPLTAQVPPLAPKKHCMADIPIMLSLTAASPDRGAKVEQGPPPPPPKTEYPVAMQRVEIASDAAGRKSLRLSRWLSTKGQHRPASSSSRKVREGLMGCEEQLKKVLKFAW